MLSGEVAGQIDDAGLLQDEAHRASCLAEDSETMFDRHGRFKAGR
jgi:hypothetical protein